MLFKKMSISISLKLHLKWSEMLFLFQKKVEFKPFCLVKAPFLAFIQHFQVGLMMERLKICYRYHETQMWQSNQVCQYKIQICWQNGSLPMILTSHEDKVCPWLTAIKKANNWFWMLKWKRIILCIPFSTHL